MSRRTYPVPEGLDGQRLDQALSRMLGLSRTRAADLVDQALITVDGQLLPKSARVLADQMVEVEDLDTPAAPRPDMDLPVLYADEDIIVVDKPVGMAVHASPGWEGATVVAALAGAGYQIAEVGSEERYGVVHRLDVGTSGVMVVARSHRAYSALKRDFKNRDVDKTYHALVQGHPDPSDGTVDAPIGRDPRHSHRFAVIADGRPSVTHYQTLEGHRFASLLEIGLETGRTHQIRVHMSALKHPCCGDLTYGADPVLSQRLGLSRQWLHAVRLTFRHPGTGALVTFESPYPADLAHALEVIRQG
ncbi:MAG: RluA family pseudouridine synthase [Actinobacteria bacterium]|jgi:23S rRNA pseudouridine1911/1915/1917 synthase|nr:RluA family pseudouridine synthase [Micrococcales bacterium]MCB0902715.1 RluA family pseudouridine synthase [Actinomycetota bacterium]MCO5298912.1 RluA family pseudouridine synthase [Candidatus Nanopelagicales bacterium]MCB9428805.1 RluA family pseudouridine synthase [Actinomycetota bacterium]HPE10958.1 RluA family pseudouridine synthase [Actinomycetota bacterium]